VANIIRTYVYSDSRKQYTNNQFELNILSDLSISGVGGTTRIPGLKSFVTVRKNSINTQLNTLGIDCSGTEIEEEITSLPDEFLLNQNYPNPFNPSTKISWQSPVSSHQTLKVFDLLGNEIATLVNEEKPAGSYEINFSVGQDSSPVMASGIYFYQLQIHDKLQTRKMLLLK
jgi:hypothetical protein